MFADDWWVVRCDGRLRCLILQFLHYTSCSALLHGATFCLAARLFNGKVATQLPSSLCFTVQRDGLLSVLQRHRNSQTTPGREFLACQRRSTRCYMSLQQCWICVGRFGLRKKNEGQYTYIVSPIASCDHSSAAPPSPRDGFAIFKIYPSFRSITQPNRRLMSVSGPLSSCQSSSVSNLLALPSSG